MKISITNKEIKFDGEEDLIFSKYSKSSNRLIGIDDRCKDKTIVIENIIAYGNCDINIVKKLKYILIAIKYIIKM